MIDCNYIKENMNLKWIIFVVIILLWIVGGFGLIIQINQTVESDMQKLEIVKTAFLILGGLGVILPTYLNIWQSIENDKIILNENAFKMIEKYEESKYIKAQKEFSDIKKMKPNISDEELIDKINENQELIDSVTSLMNYWEMIRLSIEYKRANKKIIKKYIGSLYIEFYECCLPWIESKPEFVLDAKKLYLKWKK